MSTASSNPAKTIPADEWVDLILRPADSMEIWTAIFARLRDLALSGVSPATLHRETIVPDRLLAESAWNLWQDFPRCAPTVVDELKKFWVAKPGVGTAVLILDALSLRELPLIVQAGQARGLAPVRVEARGSEVPSETDRFAEALGVAGRSKLYNNQAPGTFIFTGPDVYSDVLDGPFADCKGCSVVWSSDLLGPLITDGEAVPLRVVLGWLKSGLPENPPGDRNPILVSGLQTVLTVLPNPDASFQWLRQHILPLTKEVGNHWAGVGSGVRHGRAGEAVYTQRGG